MKCFVCGQVAPSYLLVPSNVRDPETLPGEQVDLSAEHVTEALCGECAEEYVHVAGEERTPTCIFCDDPGEYDLYHLDADVHAGSELVPTGPTLVAKDVLCDEHLDSLEEKSPVGG
ncbi:MAG: hypothetical protein ABEJ68_01040 [Halobacteriaceae archaeon]